MRKAADDERVQCGQCGQKVKFEKCWQSEVKQGYSHGHAVTIPLKIYATVPSHPYAYTVCEGSGQVGVVTKV